jgi:hypothetical protein
MRAGLVVTGVLGLGTAVVFAFAALTAALFPSGTLVGGGMNGVMMDQRFVGGGVAIPMPAPAVNLAPDVIVEAPPVDGSGGIDRRTLPGDVVVSEPTP